MSIRKIKKLLIANRGEIALRIIKTARRMGIRTVAVYSSIDQDSLFVKHADETYCVGPSASLDSYLKREAITTLATKVQADAIHPGYGFLSEDAEFARLCAREGIVFVGPSAEAIALMADKAQAKLTVLKAGVPVIPGYSDVINNEKELKKAAQKIGLPLLLKANSGGGGKGMRLVTDWEQWETALSAAKREAAAFFAKDTVFIEKYLPGARHVEVQILIDRFQQGIYLGDRDCSLQRRHQKIIEEAPAPYLSESLKQQMGNMALRAGLAIGYYNAGTIECLIDEADRFYFMEMNTRLQVEHPVTEMITGLDLVEWQIKIAEGLKIPFKQNDVHLKGHAIEARVYAENPRKHFLPSAGRISYLYLPSESDCLRVDSGITQGDLQTPYYDPLLFKLIVWAEDRDKAFYALQAALASALVIGVDTNISFLYLLLQQVLRQSSRHKYITTDFIDKNMSDWLRHERIFPAVARLAAAILVFKRHQKEANYFSETSEDHYSPWFKNDYWGWRQETTSTITYWYSNKKYRFYVAEGKSANTYLLKYNDAHTCHLQIIFKEPNQLILKYGQATRTLYVVWEKSQLYLFYLADCYVITWDAPSLGTLSTQEEKKIKSPMPGTITSILVKAGDKVASQTGLLTVEAMKMEHTLVAPCDGIVKQISCQTGTFVTEDTILIELA